MLAPAAPTDEPPRHRSLGPTRFVAVAGNIGSGKSTLVRFLSLTYGLRPFFEPNDENPYLIDFYSDMKRWAFHSQVYFLAEKFRLHRELTSSPKPIIQDRTIYEDGEIFAENLFRQRKMAKRDYESYRKLYDAMVEDLRPPGLMIFLRADLRTLRRRIGERGRREEQTMPRTYLKRLQDLYDEWYERYDRSEKILIETDRLDYIEDFVARLSLLERIEAAIGPVGATAER